MSNYTLDQQVPVMHTSNASWVTEQDMINFYSSGDISFGYHVLVINVTEASTSTPYYLDFIVYDDMDTSLSSMSSTSSTGTATSTTDTGGAVGIIATFLAIVFFCFGRRVLHRHTARKRGIRSEFPTKITPYFASRLVSSPHMSEARSPTLLQASRAPRERSSLNPLEATPSFFTLTPEDSTSPAGLGTLMVSPSGSRLSTSHKSGMPPPVASGPPAAHQADSGLHFRPETTSSEVAPDVPPLYTSN
ncbi:hypothetical protein A0H81_03875 [Grifola frondosa]|uniref:Uncharacterized protein n=1 Tax=Grifola frondosa TaxID=5627 RepID=A0A1C7MNR9_GRIFR|nr:hypothetical protein A0H81_03875 [Grifola frondosa]